MTKGLHVPSEIGKLRKVCLHRPGDELLNLPPDELERLLFDDVPFLEVAQQEHDTFAQILRDQGVEVLYLENLVAEVFDQVPGARAEFTDQYIAEAGIRGQHMPQIVREKLDSIEDNLEFVKKTMAGMTKSEIDMPLTASTTLDSLVNSESESDLIIAAGARFSDRVTGKLSEFAPHAKVIHIDIDPAEIGKIREAQVPIVGDLKGVVAGIVATIEKEACAPRTEAWNAQIAEWRERYPFYDAHITENPDEIVPEIAMQKLSAKLDPHNSVVVTEVGQHQMWAAQFIDREEPRSFISSGGLGTMGFGFPASIGAAFGRPGAQVVCIAGDGSFQMNSQEMATAAIHNVPVKVVILDNRALGMVHQWQKLFYSERYSFTELDANPDFVKLADAYSWQAERVTDPAKLDEAYDRMLACDGPFLLDVAISDQQNVFPMVAPGKAMNDVMGAIDVAVGAVRTDVPGEPAPVVREKSPCAKIDAQFGGRWESDPEDKGSHQGEEPDGEGAAEEEGDVR